MANVIRSIGYSLGKVHAGMISYLCELYREGTREPFESFLTALGVSVPSSPIPKREWEHIDLGILEKTQDGQLVPRILIEVKVDDHEAISGKGEHQTVRYAEKWPLCQVFLFVTLGKGEYCRRPRSDRFRWVRIREFLKALQAIRTQDRLISDWIEAIKREILLQDNVLIADRSLAGEYRAGAWNIYLYGRLAELLLPKFEANEVDVDMTCYTYGQMPDTIFNFGWSQDPLYMEINYSGQLNLKRSLDKSESQESRRQIVQEEIAKYEKLPFTIAPSFRPSGNMIGKTKTIASFDVGLVNKEGFLECQVSIDDVKERIFSVVSTLYGRKSGV